MSHELVHGNRAAIPPHPRALNISHGPSRGSSIERPRPSVTFDWARSLNRTSQGYRNISEGHVKLERSSEYPYPNAGRVLIYSPILLSKHGLLKDNKSLSPIPPRSSLLFRALQFFQWSPNFESPFFHQKLETFCPLARQMKTGSLKIDMGI